MLGIMTTLSVYGYAGAIRRYILLGNLANGDCQHSILCLTLNLADIRIFWELKLALERAKATLLFLLSPIDIHLLLFALTADNQLALLIYLNLYIINGERQSKHTLLTWHARADTEVTSSPKTQRGRTVSLMQNKAGYDNNKYIYKSSTAVLS